jgi:hypothetical protein
MSDRLRRWARLEPLLVAVLLGAALLAPTVGWLRLESAETEPIERMQGALDALPERAIVLVGFDPDLGTYAEIRPTVRALLADLLHRGARLAFLSLTAEGRALGLAELARLDRGAANPTRLLDLGFRPGAEAALIALTRGPLATDAAGSVAGRLAVGGIGAVDAAVVIGGNDIGPRSWVEQVRTRTDDLPLLAVAPTVLLPELQPYLASGQLEALLATPRDGAAYRASIEVERLTRFTDLAPPSAAGVLIGLLVALLVLGQAVAARLVRGRRRDAAEDAP